MCAHSKSVDLSPEARADFTSILRYSQRQWGAHQRDIYSDILKQALTTIGDHPGIGRPRNELRPGLRSFQVIQHVIYERIEPATIRVDRILHVKMDVTGAFDQ